jgi:NADH-quinone oxidoreductase subunit J
VPLDNIVFWVFAPISIASAIGMVVMRNAVHAALFLVVNFFTIAVMYLLLDAPFLFAAQIIVYAGAIMVLFLFVIMLLGIDSGESKRDPLLGQRAIAVILAVGFVLEIAVSVRAGIGFATRFPVGFDAVNRGGNTQALAAVLFRDYFFPFEVTSILLIIAAIAAMVLAQRRSRAISQAEIDAHRGDLDGLGTAAPGSVPRTSVPSVGPTAFEERAR